MTLLPHRRDFLKTSLLAAMAPMAMTRAFGRASAGGPLGPIRREIFIPSPRPGVSAIAGTYYTRRTGTDLISIHQLMARSDTVDFVYFRYSSDNGRTWGNQNEVPAQEIRPNGKWRRAPRGCVVDSITGRFVYFSLVATLPTDDPLEGMRQWTVYYSVSENAGFDWYLDEEIVQGGKEFTSSHPLPGIWTGHNGIMIGDIASQPIVLADGTFLVPIIVTPIGPDGNYYNPGGGYTYTIAGVLRGRWAADGRHLQWEMSQLVETDPKRTTRGSDEPTLAQLADGRLLMVIRGSNDKKYELPGRRWVSHSSDQGRTWSRMEPWTYSNGEDFFSPAASSLLLTHSSGKIYWLGNISPTNTAGNNPRYPFVIGEVNRTSGLLEKDSVRVVDTRGPNDSVMLALSSPCAREDRETGEIVLNLTRWGQHSTATVYNWTTDAYLYRIPVA